MNDELEKLLAEATPGPWEKSGVRTKCIIEDAISIGAGGLSYIYLPIGKTHNEQAGALKDAALICAAVNALPELLAEVKRLEEALAPFAAVVDLDVSEYCSDSDWFTPMSAQHARAPRLTVGDLRRARAALNQETKP